MNIERLAKHLKEFTLEEIEMIAESDCEMELEQLIKSNKIVLISGKYTYQEEKPKQEYIVLANQNTNFQVINFKNAIEYFLEKYVKINCKPETYRRYKGFFKYHILPFFNNKKFNTVRNNDILEFYYFCKNRKLSPKGLKNTLTLLNQMIKYYQNLGIINKSCNFQVRRLSDKTKFTTDEIIFK